MKNFTVYFEIYGKKMKVNIKAVSKDQAERIVRNDLNILQVEIQIEKPKNNENEIFKFFDQIFK